MSDLGTRIQSAIEELDVPDVDLVKPVLAQLQLGSAPDRARRPQLVFALAAVVLVLVGIVAIAPAREAVANWLGIGATEIQPVEQLELPETSSVDSLGDPPATADGDEIAMPNPIPSLGEPTGVFDDENRGRSYTWPAADGLSAIANSEIAVVLSVRPADRVLSLKQVFADDEFGEVQFPTFADGRVGFWIGGQHVLVTSGSSRPVAANQVLLWVVDDVEFRLETALALPEVMVLAEQVRNGTDLLPPG